MSLLGLISFANIFIKVLMCVFNFSLFKTVFDQSVDTSRKLTLKTENIEKSKNCNNVI